MSDDHERIDAEIVRVEASSDPFAAAVRATRMPMIVTDPNQPDNPIVFANAAFYKLTGFTQFEIIGQNCRFLQGPETDPDAVALVRDAIARRVPIEIELRNYKKSGAVFWNHLLLSPVFDRDGVLTHFFASLLDVTPDKDRLLRLQEDRDALEQEVQRRTAELTRSEERLRFMLKAGPFGYWTLDLSDQTLMASEICKENFGRSAQDPFGYDDLLAAIVDDDRARMQATVRDAIEHKRDYDIEYRVLTPTGEIRWLHIRGQTFYGADGSPLSMAGVSIDITERKRGDEHRIFLAEELNHRVKNTMATVQSIVHQTLRTAPTMDEARTTLDARIQSLSAAHDVLTRESWEGATLADIIENALQPFRSCGAERFAAKGPHVRLPPRLALAFVMALHELATNAVKYGALSNDSGRVLLRWAIDDGAKPGRLWLRWEEVGGPTVTPPSRKGFGSRMIERALAAELDGHAEITYRPDGVVFTVEAPLP